MEFDILIRNGKVLDGTGNPWFQADVGVKDRKIVEVGFLKHAAGRRSIDASGLFVAPGFVDAHTHSEFGLIYNPPAESHVAQGITTEVLGNCGYSPFPRVEASKGLLCDPEGVEGDWVTANEFFAKVRDRSFGVNAVTFVGHITIRTAVMGREARPARHEEIEEMKGYVRLAMEAGALGLSTGLDYPPSNSATTDELVALCEVVAEYGGMYSSHLRGYADTVLDAVEEAITIGRRTGIPIQLSHLIVFGRQNWGKGPQIVEMVDQARAEGIDVTADIMAYPTAGAWWAPRSVFSEDVYDWRVDSSIELENLRQKLSDPVTREELRQETKSRRTMEKHGFHEAFIIFNDWGDIYIEGVADGSPNEEYVGLSVAEITAREDKDPVDTYFDLVLQEGPELNSVHITESEDDYLAMLTAPWCMFGTDTIATSIERASEPYNVLQHHPRGYGSYPRILRLFVKEKQVLRLEEAVRKMTSLAAQRFGLDNRGLVREGMQADLVIFDFDTVTDRSTYLHPKRYPEGIEYVLVNGEFAVDTGQLTQATGGRILRAAA